MGEEGNVRAKRPASPQRTTTVVAALVAPLTAFCAFSSLDHLPTGLLAGVTGTLAGAALVYLLTLHRGRRRTIAALLISSWCAALVASTFLPAPSGTHPFFDLREPGGCLAYGFALGFGVAAVGRWVNAGGATGRPDSEGAGPRSRRRRCVVATRRTAGRRSRCSPSGRVEGFDGTP